MTLRPEPEDVSLKRRSPDLVMRLARLGALHQSRLSFMRILTRRLKADKWTFSRDTFEIDTNGVGHAVYSAHGPERTYSLVAFAHDLPDDLRSDRVIAEAWDATFALFDGRPEPEDIARLSTQVPLQEAGRVSERELVLSRANRSTRVWTHVIDALARGVQPDPTLLNSVGYLMRTTAVYGSGKFGAADRESIAEREELSAPFQVEMLTVYLIRWFVRDLVEHMASSQSPETATRLDPETARTLAIGNATGLGMAPFLINHPVLLNNWIAARETALAHVRAEPTRSSSAVRIFRACLAATRTNAHVWVSSDTEQQTRIRALCSDLDQIEAAFERLADTPQPWDALYLWAESALSLEAQEALVSLFLEAHPAHVDSQTQTLADPAPKLHEIDGTMRVSELRALLDTSYGWAQTTDWTKADETARIWYISQEKLEPRLGEISEPGLSNYAQPLAPGRDAWTLRKALDDVGADATVAEFLVAYPAHRHAVRRVQHMQILPYGEIHDNTISAALRPIDMLRCKLSFFGATDFDPRSDRWLRIRMFAGAPYPDELENRDGDRWIYRLAVA